MQIRTLFPDQAAAARAAGHEVDAAAPVVLISVDPWLAITGEAFEVIRAAVERLQSEEHSRKIIASGKAGRPRVHDVDFLRQAVESYGSVREASRHLKISRNTFKRYLG
jgi:hypothetical protein